MEKQSQEKISLLALILKRMNNLGWKQIDLSRQAGVSPPVVNRLFKQGKQISVENIGKILGALGLIQPDKNESQPQLEPGTHLVPWLEGRPENANSVFENDVFEDDVFEPDQPLPFPKDWLSRRFGEADLRAVRVQGESMAPLIQDGDVVLVDITQTEWHHIKDGKIYVFREGAAPKVRRLVKRGPAELWEVSDNTQFFPDRQVDLNKFALVGKVVWVGHEVG